MATDIDELFMYADMARRIESFRYGTDQLEDDTLDSTLPVLSVHVCPVASASASSRAHPHERGKLPCSPHAQTCPRPCTSAIDSYKLVRLPDGDLHVCLGCNCQFATKTKENELVCSLTGEMVGVVPTREVDPSWCASFCALKCIFL